MEYSLEIATAYPSASLWFEVFAPFDLRCCANWIVKGSVLICPVARSAPGAPRAGIATFVTSRILRPFGEFFSAPQNKRSKERGSLAQRGATAQRRPSPLSASQPLLRTPSPTPSERARVTHSAVHACWAGGDSCVRTALAPLSLLHK